MGTDYNEGVKGIGPKKALDLIRKYGKIEKIPNIETKLDLKEVEEIREIFLNPSVSSEYDVSRKPLNEEAVIKFLCDERDFSETRVRKALERIKEKLGRKSLDLWFK